MASRHLIANTIAATLLGGDWGQAALQLRMTKAFGRTAQQSQRQIVSQVLASNPNAYPPAPAWLTKHLLGSKAFHRLAASLERRDQPIHAALQSPLFSPAPVFAGLSVPQLSTAADLAAWLGLSIEELDWFSDQKRQHIRANAPSLQHYNFQLIAKRSGSFRLIEAPKARIKTIQTRILRDILDLVPAHDHAHGFVRGRSCASFAQVHASEAVVVKFDLRDFFPATPAKRVHGSFRSIGYPWAVARLLTGLCCTSTPTIALAALPRADHRHLAEIFGAPHLPQGAPTSPSLANLCAWHLDSRLAGLASAFAANYTRYADDLVFSGDDIFATKVARLVRAVEEVAMDEGYRLNKAKTRIMRASGRQMVCGIVVNSHVNIPRRYYDELRAILHNCSRRGADTENRDKRQDFRAYVDGRLAWLESVNPARGAKMRTLFNRIDWSASAAVR